MAEPRVTTEDAESSDLVVGTIYEGGPSLSDEPIHKLVGTGNMGGIRKRGGSFGTSLIALFSTEDQPDWPDGIDRSTGSVVYFGDNREPGFNLLSRSGNKALHDIFQERFDSEKARLTTLLFFVFTSAPVGVARSVRFEGLAVPGDDSPEEDWCVARWHAKAGQKFQNYTIRLTLLADRVITQKWIEDSVSGDRMGDNCPDNYRFWVETGLRTPLTTR